MNLLPFLSLAIGTLALEPIVIKNNSFIFENSDERFYIRGVDYQPGGSSNLTDPLADVSICKRDIPYFQELGLNTIRVYSVDNTQDHTECMDLLADAGIYLIVDVNTPKTSISRHNANCSYNVDYMTEVFATIDSFANFTNTLGFFSANELINEEEYFDLSPYIKAVTRDMKQYMRAQGYRTIPVGYAAADVASIRYELADYLNCGDDADARIDMLGDNDYSWCGHSSFLVSGYEDKVKEYNGYSIPLFMSEYGCNQVAGGVRPFTEVSTIYSDLMSSVYSGGLVYQFFEDTNHYGLVELNNDKISTMPDFDTLKNELNQTSNPTGNGGSKQYNFSACPTGLNFSLAVPPQPAGLTDLIKNGPQGQNIGFDATTQDSCDSDDNDDSWYSSIWDSTTTSSLNSSSASSESSSSLSTSTTTTTTTSATVSSISSNSKNDATGSLISFSNWVKFFSLFISLLTM